jgi:hypothetical protein
VQNYNIIHPFFLDVTNVIVEETGIGYQQLTDCEETIIKIEMRGDDRERVNYTMSIPVYTCLCS